MNRQQVKAEIDRAERMLRAALEECDGSLPEAEHHLHYACAHAREAWLDLDYQKPRTVEAMQRDLLEGLNLLNAMRTAQPGQTVEAFGKKWTVGNQPPGSSIRSAIKQKDGQ